MNPNIQADAASMPSETTAIKTASEGKSALQYFKQALKKVARFMDGLKRSPRHLKALIALNLFMAVASNVVDWSWLTTVAGHNPWLLPFTPICSLYPLLMGLWGIWYYRLNHASRHHISPVGTKAVPQGGKLSASLPHQPKTEPKKIPLWFTLFLFIGVVSYGIMAYIYFPLYMVNIHASWRVVGNMLWVTVYALQSLTILSELRPVGRRSKASGESSSRPYRLGLPLWQFALIAGYFFFKDYSDRYLGSFLDIFVAGYPEWLKDFSFTALLIIHLGVSVSAGKILQARRSVPRDA